MSKVKPGDLVRMSITTTSKYYKDFIICLNDHSGIYLKPSSELKIMIEDTEKESTAQNDFWRKLVQKSEENSYKIFLALDTIDFTHAQRIPLEKHRDTANFQSLTKLLAQMAGTSVDFDAFANGEHLAMYVCSDTASSEQINAAFSNVPEKVFNGYANQAVQKLFFSCTCI